MNKVFVSQKSDNLITPYELYNFFKWHGFFDPCPLDGDGFDAFLVEWGPKNFVNPPYSDISRFLEKAYCEHALGKEIFLLVPARTSSKWFEKVFRYGAHFIFIKGRLRFGGSKDSAPFDSVIIKLTGTSSFMSVVAYSELLHYLEEYEIGSFWQGGGI